MISPLATRYREIFADQTTFGNIRMTLIGGWQDLTAYYAGSDGNAWSATRNGFSNRGDLEEFRRTFHGRYRGELVP